MNSESDIRLVDLFKRRLRLASAIMSSASRSLTPNPTTGISYPEAILTVDWIDLRDMVVVWKWKVEDEEVLGYKQIKPVGL